VTKPRFGFHRKHERGSAAYVQIYVKSSALSRAPDLAISAHLLTEGVYDAQSSLPPTRMGSFMRKHPRGRTTA
jgi:hypothetical protein